MFKNCYILFLLSLQLMSIVVSGQVMHKNMQLRQIDIKDGLSENIVLSILEDRHGFIWVGTYDGLDKYDGYNFKIYRDEFLINKNSSNNRIYSVRNFANGKLNVIKDEGCYIFDPKTETAKYLNNEFESAPRITSHSDDNKYWIVTENANLYHCNQQTEDCTVYKSPLEETYIEKSLWSTSLFSSHENRVFYTNNLGTVVSFDKTTKKFNFFETGLNPSAYFTNACLDGFGNIWQSSVLGKLIMFNTKEDTFSQVLDLNEFFPKIEINDIYHDEKFDAILICTKKHGLISFDYTSRNFIQYHIEAPGKKSLTSESVITVLRDSKNVLWIGTDQHGLLIHDANREKFNAINPSRHNKYLSLRMPRKFAGDDYGNVWIGTNNLGLWKFNLEKDELDIYTNNSNPDFMKDNSAIQLYAEKNELWIGHNGEGISIIDIPSLKLKKSIILKSQDERIKDNNVIWNFLRDKKGRMWIGTRAAGLYRIDNQEIKHFHSFNTELSYNNIMSSNQLNDGTILITTRIGGVYKWIESKDDFVRVYPNEDSLVIAPKALEVDYKNRIWMGTDGRGVYVLDKDFKLLKHLNSAQGNLMSDVTCSFLEDKNGNMWVSTNHGISKINIGENINEIKTAHYSSFDGLTSDEFMTGAYLKTDSTFWMGNISGVNYFNPENIPTNDYTYTSYISNIEVNDNHLFPDTNYYYVNDIKLKHNQNSILFEYNTIGYTIPEETYYSFRLKGLNDEWSSPSNRVITRFTNLSPGNYSFELKCRNYDGVWNETPINFDFEIETPFWKRSWFRLLICFLIAALTTGIIRFRVQQFRKREKLKNKYKAELTEMEMTALRSQINPHFLFNTLNSINNYILRNEGDKASKYLVKFSSLMRTILSNSSKKYISLTDELKALQLYIEMENMRFTNAFEYFINIDSSINPDEINIAPMLVQPFVENAIWHGLLHKEGDKTLEINITNHDKERLKISIVDNGVGREKSNALKSSAKKGKSYGMKLTQKRIDLLNSHFQSGNTKSLVEVVDLNIKDHGTSGTIINIIIPKL